jgi:hypothetical protein
MTNKTGTSSLLASLQIELLFFLYNIKNKLNKGLIMKKNLKYFTLVCALFALMLISHYQTAAQDGGKEVYTGTILSYGSGFNTRRLRSTLTARHRTIRRRTCLKFSRPAGRMRCKRKLINPISGDSDSARASGCRSMLFAKAWLTGKEESLSSFAVGHVLRNCAAVIVRLIIRSA